MAVCIRVDHWTMVANHALYELGQALDAASAAVDHQDPEAALAAAAALRRQALALELRVAREVK